MRASILVRGEQPPVAPHAGANELERAARRRRPLGPAEHAPGVRHAADRERVPRHQHFFVAARAHSLFARGKQFSPGVIDERLGARLEGARRVQVPVPVLEIRRPVQPKARGERQVFLLGQELLRLLAAPDVELALLVLAVCIERGVVAALRRLHLAHDPPRGLPGATRVEHVVRHEPDVGEQGEQRAVVVEHLLEVRDHPLRVDAVAAESAAELVIDAAFAHALERRMRHLDLAIAQAQLEVGRMRKLRRDAEAAETRIEIGAQVVQHRAHHIGGKIRTRNAALR